MEISSLGEASHRFAVNYEADPLTEERDFLGYWYHRCTSHPTLDTCHTMKYDTVPASGMINKLRDARGYQKALGPVLETRWLRRWPMLRVLGPLRRFLLKAFLWFI